MITATTPTATFRRVRNVLEYAAGKSARVDEVNNVIHGVKVIGLESLNGRRYTLEAIRKAAPLYEGADVFVDHLKPGQHRRSDTYGDRLGSIKNFRVEADGGYADLHYNPHHPRAAAIVFEAKTQPNKLGLSHHADITESNERPPVVYSIDRVYSVDVVKRPATTRGIFENAPDVTPEERQQGLLRYLRGGSTEVYEDMVPTGSVPMVDDAGAGGRGKPPKRTEADVDGAKRLLLEKLQAAFDGPGDYRAALVRLRKILDAADGSEAGGDAKPVTEAAPLFGDQSARLEYLRGATPIGAVDEETRQARIQRLRS
jgi:hypothetical protein